jgi:5-methylcytosine-specific restriction protein A
LPGYCDKHKQAARKAHDDRRGTAAERGYDSKWAKARLYYLRKHPLCVNCKLDRRIVAAQVVDHIEPHKLKDAIDSGDEQRIAKASALFWNSSNWAPLCKPCHDSVAQSCERNGTRKPWDKRGTQ